LPFISYFTLAGFSVEISFLLSNFSLLSQSYSGCFGIPAIP
jgi:hypothetical protein